MLRRASWVIPLLAIAVVQPCTAQVSASLIPTRETQLEQIAGYLGVQPATLLEISPIRNPDQPDPDWQDLVDAAQAVSATQLLPDLRLARTGNGAARARLLRQVASSGDVDVALTGGASGSLGADEGAAGGSLQPIGFQVWTEDQFLVGISFNRGATQAVSAEERRIATNLRSPGQGGQGAYIRGFYQFTDNKIVNPAVSARFNLSAQEWTVPDFDGAGTERSADGNLIDFSLLARIVSKRFAADQNNSYTVGLDIGWTRRSIGGDLGAQSNADFRQAVLGVDKTSFSGLEITLFATMNTIAPYARITRFSDEDGEILGFTGTQFEVGLDVLAAWWQTEN